VFIKLKHQKCSSQKKPNNTHSVIVMDTLLSISLNWKKVFQKGKRYSYFSWISSNYFSFHMHFKSWDFEMWCVWQPWSSYSILSWMKPLIQWCFWFPCQIEVLEESKIMIPDCKRRLKTAYEDLAKLVVSELIGITFCI